MFSSCALSYFCASKWADGSRLKITSEKLLQAHANFKSCGNGDFSCKILLLDSVNPLVYGKKEHVNNLDQSDEFETSSLMQITTVNEEQIWHC